MRNATIHEIPDTIETDFEASSVETIRLQWMPSQELISIVIDHPNVRPHIRDDKNSREAWTTLYLTCGIKIARDFHLRREENTGANLRQEGDVGVGGESQRTDAMSSSGKSRDIILAYELLRIGFLGKNLKHLIVGEFDIRL